MKCEMRRVVSLLISGEDAIDGGLRRGCRHYHVGWGKLIVEVVARRSLRPSYDPILVNSAVVLSCMIRLVEARVKSHAFYRMCE